MGFDTIEINLVEDFKYFNQRLKNLQLMTWHTSIKELKYFTNNLFGMFVSIFSKIHPKLSICLEKYHIYLFSIKIFLGSSKNLDSERTMQENTEAL